MIRVILLVLVIIALSLGGAWIADHPGSFSVDWLGWRVETSFAVALAVLVVGLAALAIIVRLLSGLVTGPKSFLRRRAERRRRRGLEDPRSRRSRRRRCPRRPQAVGPGGTPARCPAARRYARRPVGPAGRGSGRGRAPLDPDAGA